ncbi:hypothetical protein D3Y57_13265 [Sphingomonas paeninsulae]|uniref:Uncharacterized protein n=1 Tax=Sphingomonas paeninsulae TaxID=2319844 RepID=A0A494TIE4_SPHPE|nr:hypothetical protein [Sphingomonas paeninsulae]AYJ86753.1 hypothetical protein D3Y57_13265 [Sphingomonas paeninsulae]
MNTKFLPMAAVLLAVPFGINSAIARDRAKTATVETPAPITALAKCRQLTDNAQRLSCYDLAVAELSTAIATKNVYVVDKTSVRKAQSSLFGLELPSLGLFTGDATDSNAVTQLDGVIASAAQESFGNWRVTLEDGSVWLQTDEVPLGVSLKATNKVTVKRGLMGSYKMSVNGRPAFRVKRVA